MTIKQQGGIFGRNPTFNDVDAASVDINSGATGGSPLTLTTAASGHNIDMTDSTSTARIRNVGGRLHITADVNDEAASSAIRFYVDNTRMIDINDSGNIVFNSAGQGIDFSATSGTGTSELFDDYEEGTWTVELYDAASGGNVSPTTTTGYYTKIGRQVSLTFSLSNIDTTGMTSGNQLYFTLPFTAGFVSTGSLALESFALSVGRTWAAPWVNAADTRGRFRQSGNAVTAASLTVASITSGSSDIERCTLTYFVG